MRPLLGTLVLAFLPGCTTDLELSPRAQVGCSDASPCPPGFVCNQAGRCERTDALDRTPPALLTGPDLTPPRGRTGTTFSLSFEVSEPLSIAPEVTIDLGARQAPWEAAGQEGDGYTFTYEATGGEPEGERDVSIRLLDLAGNELVDASASLSFDFTPPRLLAEPAPSPTQLRDGAPARLELLVTEGCAYADAAERVTRDVAAQRAKGVEAVDRDSVDTVVTLCAEEVCPVLPGLVRRLHWGLPDPAATDGDEPARLRAFAFARDQLHRRISCVFGR